MKKVNKTFCPRLPKEAREKLATGGRHHDKKSDYKRRPKHANNQKKDL